MEAWLKNKENMSSVWFIMNAVPCLRRLHEFTISSDAEQQLGGCFSLSSKAQLREIECQGMAVQGPAPDCWPPLLHLI